MTVNINKVAICCVIAVYFMAVGFLSPDFTTDYIVNEGLMYGAIAREHSANPLVRSVWFLILALSIIGIFYKNKTIVFAYNNRKLLPSMIFLLFFFISCFWAQDYSRSLVQFAKHIFIFICFYFSFAFISEHRFLQILNTLFKVVLAVALLSMPFGFSWSEIGYKGIHGHKNTAGMIYSVGFIFYFLSSFIKFSKANMLLSCAFLFLTVISESKTSLALALFCSFLFVMRSKNVIKNIHVQMVVFFIFISLFFMIAKSEYLYSAGYTFTGRTALWTFISDEVSLNPFLGYGFSGFWDYGEEGRYFVYGDLYYDFIMNLNQSHNTYLDILLHGGIVGLFLLFFMLIRVAKHVLFNSKISGMYGLFSASALLFILMHSLMESTLLRGENFLWILFLSILFISCKAISENRITRCSDVKGSY